MCATEADRAYFTVAVGEHQAPRLVTDPAEGAIAPFPVIVPIVRLNHRASHLERRRICERKAMLGDVRGILVGIIDDFHGIKRTDV